MIQLENINRTLLNLATEADHMLKMRQSIQEMENGKVHDFADVAEKLFKKHFPAKTGKGRKS